MDSSILPSAFHQRPSAVKPFCFPLALLASLAVQYFQCRPGWPGYLLAWRTWRFSCMLSGRPRLGATGRRAANRRKPVFPAFWGAFRRPSRPLRWVYIPLPPTRMASWGESVPRACRPRCAGKMAVGSADAAVRRRQCPRISAENLTTRRASIDLIVEK